MEDGKKLVVCCRTVAALKSIRVRLEPLAKKGHQLRYLTGETKESEAKNMFQDLDTFMQGTQVFIFTSRLTVGADIQTPVHRVYFHGGGRGGPTARTAWQMLLRARNVRTREIRCFLAHRNREKQDRFLEDDICVRNLMEDVAQRRKNVSEFSRKWILDGKIQKLVWEPDELMRAYAYGRVEQDHNFSSDFIAKAEGRRYTVTLPTLCTKEPDGVELNKFDRDAQLVRALQNVDSDPSVQQRQLANVKRRCERSHTAEEDEYCFKEVLEVCARFSGCIS